MVVLSIFAETVTPLIFAPAADFTVPVSSMPSGAACAIRGRIAASTKQREGGADEFHERTSMCVIHCRLSFFLVERAPGGRGPVCVLRRLRHRFQIFDNGVNLRRLQSELESRHFARSAPDHLLD